MVDRLAGILLGDVSKVRIDGCRRGAAVAENTLDMTQA